MFTFEPRSRKTVRFTGQRWFTGPLLHLESPQVAVRRKERGNGEQESDQGEDQRHDRDDDDSQKILSCFLGRHVHLVNFLFERIQSLPQFRIFHGPSISGRNAFIEYRPVLFEKEFRDVKNSVCDEERGENVDRVVQMPQEHDSRKEHGPGEKNIPEYGYLPEYKREQEGCARMSRKEQVASADEFRDDSPPIKRYAIGERSDVREADEERAQYVEDAERRGRKREPAELREYECDRKDHEYERAYHEKTVDIECRRIGENDVGNEISGNLGRIRAGIKIQNDADGQDGERNGACAEKPRIGDVPPLLAYVASANQQNEFHSG